MNKKKKLSMKQQRFITAYIECKGNATAAALKSGYSKKSAATQGNINLANPTIKAEIDKRLGEMQKKDVATAEEVLSFLTRVMRGEELEQEFYVKQDENGNNKVETFEVKPRINSRLEASKSLARTFGMFKDSLDINDSNIVVELVD